MADLIDKPDQWGKRPLASATEYRRIGMISVLNKHGANMNAVDPKRRMVMHHQRDKQTVQALLNNEAKIDHEDKDGCTPLILAASDHDNDRMQALLECGANASVVGYHGLTALMIAVQNNDEHICT